MTAFVVSEDESRPAVGKAIDPDAGETRMRPPVVVQPQKPRPPSDRPLDEGDTMIRGGRVRRRQVEPTAQDIIDNTPYVPSTGPAPSPTAAPRSEPPLRQSASDYDGSSVPKPRETPPPPARRLGQVDEAPAKRFPPKVVIGAAAAAVVLLAVVGFLVLGGGGGEDNAGTTTIPRPPTPGPITPRSLPGPKLNISWTVTGAKSSDRYHVTVRDADQTDPSFDQTVAERSVLLQGAQLPKTDTFCVEVRTVRGKVPSEPSTTGFCD
jgi:hypothetical protein